MVWNIFEHRNQFINTEKIKINNQIPCLKFTPRDNKGIMPTVIFYHGWHSSKDFQRFKAQILACNGYQVFVPDALHHGERDPIDHDAPEMLDKYLWEIIFQTVRESETLIDLFKKFKNFKPELHTILNIFNKYLDTNKSYLKEMKRKIYDGFHVCF
jgi:dienelactone hydrolase